MSSVFATYEDISDCWPIFKHNIDPFFPLKNVHKPKNLGLNDTVPMIRSIPLISVKFIPFKAETLSLKSELNLHERPFLHLFIGLCEDIDVYRQSFRPKLKTWFESIQNKKHSQLIIILLERNSNIEDSFKNGKTFLIDKIRFDFSDKSLFKLLSMKILPGDNLNSLPDCIELISDCLYHSVISHFRQMDEDISKISQQRSLPGWNFLSFFLTKESKALTFSDLGLFPEALAIYDELDALFFELKYLDNEAGGFLSQFSSSQTLNSREIELIAHQWTIYRQKIHNSQISRFEFILYVFSRQVSLLFESKQFSEILKRSKYFLCNTIFTHGDQKSVRQQWILDIIFYVLKLIDVDSLNLDIYDETSCYLVDLLLLAIDQIDSTNSKLEFSKDMELKVNFSQIANISNSSLSENPILFKILVSRFCLEILQKSPSNYKRIAVKLKLAQLYYKVKMFENSVEILHEASSLEHAPLNWPQIQISLLDLFCDCYWNLKKFRDYLGKQFEMILIEGSENLMNTVRQDKIIQASLLLDDTFSLEFDKFFQIKNFDLDNLSICAVFSSNFKLPLQNCRLSIILSGENNDISWTSSFMEVRDKSLILNASLENNFRPGVYKLKKVELIFNKLTFVSENFSPQWGTDINILSNDRLSFLCLLPDHLDLNEPILIINCKNRYAQNIFDLSISAENNDIKLIPAANEIYHNKDLSVDDAIDIRFSILNFSPGSKSIKITSSYKIGTESDRTYNLVSFVSIDIPKMWRVESDIFSYLQFHFASFRVFYESQIYDTISLYSSWSAMKSSIFEINHNSSFRISNNKNSDLKSVSLKYLTDDQKLKIMTIPVHCPFVFKNVSCTCLPMVEDKEIRIGEPVEFKVQIKGMPQFKTCRYILSFDINSWMLSGPSTGLSKEEWSFKMIPIRHGFVMLPVVSFSEPTPIHVLTNGANILVKSNN